MKEVEPHVRERCQQRNEVQRIRIGQIAPVPLHPRVNLEDKSHLPGEIRQVVDEVILQAPNVRRPNASAAQHPVEAPRRRRFRDVIRGEGPFVGVGKLDPDRAPLHVALGELRQHPLRVGETADRRVHVLFEAASRLAVVKRKRTFHPERRGEILRLPVLEPRDVAHLRLESAHLVRHVVVPSVIRGLFADGGAQALPVVVVELGVLEPEKLPVNDEAVAPVGDVARLGEHPSQHVPLLFVAGRAGVRSLARGRLDVPLEVAPQREKVERPPPVVVLPELRVRVTVDRPEPL